MLRHYLNAWFISYLKTALWQPASLFFFTLSLWHHKVVAKTIIISKLLLGWSCFWFPSFKGHLKVRIKPTHKIQVLWKLQAGLTIAMAAVLLEPQHLASLSQESCITWDKTMIHMRYCWWFRNPKQIPGMSKTSLMMGYLPYQLVGRISEPSTVSSVLVLDVFQQQYTSLTCHLGCMHLPECNRDY